MNKPLIVALEGNPGSGKTTIKNILAIDSLLIDRVDQILPDNPDSDLDLNLDDIIASDRAKTARCKKQGHDIVLLDRYYLSTLAYQYAFDVLHKDGSFKAIKDKYNAYLSRGLLVKPDITFYIDVPISLSLSRKGRHQNSDFVWTDNIFLSLNLKFYKNQTNLTTIDGTQTLESIKSMIESIIRKRYAQR